MSHFGAPGAHGDACRTTRADRDATPGHLLARIGPVRGQLLRKKLPRCGDNFPAPTGNNTVGDCGAIPRPAAHPSRAQGERGVGSGGQNESALPFWLASANQTESALPLCRLEMFHVEPKRKRASVLVSEHKLKRKRASVLIRARCSTWNPKRKRASVSTGAGRPGKGGITVSRGRASRRPRENR